MALPAVLAEGRDDRRGGGEWEVVVRSIQGALWCLKLDF